MKYALERISTVQACDALLAGAKKKKQNLERRLRNLGESLATFRKRLDQVRQDTVQLWSLLEVFTGTYGSLADGRDKVNMKIRIKRLELRQAMLEKKAATYHAGALLVKEMQYNGLHSQVWALENYIAAVEQHRVALLVPTLRIDQSVSLLRQPVAHPALIPSVLRGPGLRTSHFRMGLSYILIRKWRTTPAVIPEHGVGNHQPKSPGKFLHTL